MDDSLIVQVGHSGDDLGEDREDPFGFALFVGVDRTDRGIGASVEVFAKRLAFDEFHDDPALLVLIVSDVIDGHQVGVPEV